jgi:hypothetical protein
MSNVREKIISIARSEIGPGRVDTYWRDVLVPGSGPPFPKHWCGAFALWCLRRAGLAPDVRWRIGYGFLEVERLPKTREPKPGDVAYFDKPFQHHALFEAQTADGFLLTIDGNQPDVRAQRRLYPSGAIFYSIEPLIARAELYTEPAPAPRVDRDPHSMPVLRQGSRGADVELLQELLNAGLKIDGDFGPKTALAVEQYQREHLLKPDRVVGPITWAELLSEQGAA